MSPLRFDSFFSLPQLPFLGLFSLIMASSGVFSRALFPSRKRQMSTRFSACDDHLFFFLLLFAFRNNHSIEAAEQVQTRWCWKTTGTYKWNPPINFKWFNARSSLQQVSAYCVRRPIISLRDNTSTMEREPFFLVLLRTCHNHANSTRVSSCFYKTIHSNEIATCRRAIYITRRTRQFPIYFKSPALLIRVYAYVLTHNTRWIKHTLCV